MISNPNIITSAMLWDETSNSGKGSLTSFGTFFFVLLAFTIPFSVIKSCLSFNKSKVGSL